MTAPIVVTGAAGGIGAALCRHLLASGHSVTGIDLAPFPDALAQTVGFDGRHADVTDEPALEDALPETLGGVIVNAAVTDLAHRNVVEIPYADWRKVLDVNVNGAFLTARCAAKRMAAGGNIVFVTSSLARLSDAQAGDAPYCTSKAAVEMLVRVMALELQDRGINVNTVFPSAMIDTGFFAHWPDEERTRLAPPTILNATAAFLLRLPAGVATGRSLDQDLWDRDERYRATWGAE